MNSLNGNVIRTQGLTKAYQGAKALDSLNLEVPKNSIFGFLGPNGAGKSTTIKMLLGLTHPSSGKALIFGQDITQESLAIRRRVGYLAQDPSYYEHMTARQTLRYTARFFYSSPKDLIEARIEEMLELTGLEDKADRPIKGFSGGERQRLGIAQAQVNYPDLLILDEPAAALDPQGRRDVLTVMETLRKYTTIFYSTHILDDVQRVSDRVAILKSRQAHRRSSHSRYLIRRTGAVSMYNVTIMGDAKQAQSRVASQPWVKSLNSDSTNGVTTWQVNVNDDDAAEEQMLRLILDERNLRVKSFGRKTHNLEEVFLSLVGEESST